MAKSAAARSVTEDYGVHAAFSFSAVPKDPPLANLEGRILRWFNVAFKQSWLAVCLFRIKSRLQRWRVPLLPGICDLISRSVFDVSIGNRVRIGPGLMITHGNVIIDGRTQIGARCQISPFVTIGLTNSRKRGFSVDGPTIGDDVHIGTGAKVLGHITVGHGVRIGANAVVIDDVPPGETVVGAPARVVARRPLLRPVRREESGRDERLVAHMRDAIAGYRARRARATRSRRGAHRLVRARLRPHARRRVRAAGRHHVPRGGRRRGPRHRRLAPAHGRRRCDRPRAGGDHLIRRRIVLK